MVTCTLRPSVSVDEDAPRGLSQGGHAAWVPFSVWTQTRISYASLGVGEGRIWAWAGDTPGPRRSLSLPHMGTWAGGPKVGGHYASPAHPAARTLEPRGDPGRLCLVTKSSSPALCWCGPCRFPGLPPVREAQGPEKPTPWGQRPGGPHARWGLSPGGTKRCPPRLTRSLQKSSSLFKPRPSSHRPHRRAYAGEHVYTCTRVTQKRKHARGCGRVGGSARGASRASCPGCRRC